MVQLNAKGSLDDMDKMLELLESLKPEERMWYWETIEQSFEGIPSYYPFGLRHKRTESIQQIREWFKESRPNLYYDEENHIWKVRKP